MVYCNPSGFDRLKSKWHGLVDTQPRDPPTDPKCLLWYERVKCSRLDLFVPVFQAFFVLLDAGWDLKVAVMHWKNGDHWWSLYTVFIVAITQIFLQLVSAFWFIEDARDEDDEKEKALEENGVRVGFWVVASHFVFLGRFVRFYQTLKVLCKIRSEARKTSLENDESARQEFIRRHFLYLTQTADSNTLGLIEAFLEGAPQVALQLHIFFRQSHEDLTSPKRVEVLGMILKSLVLFAFSHLSYTRSIRKVSEDAAQLELVSAGAVALYSWRFFMLVSRVLILALFSSTFPYYIYILVPLRFWLFLRIVAKQECAYFSDSTKKQNLLKLAFAYIHIFSFFPLISSKTQKLGVVYYLITFAENSVVLILWVFFSSWSDVLKIAAVVIVNFSFAVGLVCLALYYRRFHPSRLEATKTMPSLAAPTVVDSGGVNLCFITPV